MQKQINMSSFNKMNVETNDEKTDAAVYKA